MDAPHEVPLFGGAEVMKGLADPDNIERLVPGVDRLDEVLTAEIDRTGQGPQTQANSDVAYLLPHGRKFGQASQNERRSTGQIVVRKRESVDANYLKSEMCPGLCIPSISGHK